MENLKNQIEILKSKTKIANVKNSWEGFHSILKQADKLVKLKIVQLSFYNWDTEKKMKKKNKALEIQETWSSIPTYT